MKFIDEIGGIDEIYFVLFSRDNYVIYEKELNSRFNK